MRFRTALRALLPALLMAGLAQLPAQAYPPYRSSSNMELVAHLPGCGGSDLEFFTRELRTYKNFLGEFRTVAEEDPPVTRHFAMVGNRSASCTGLGPMSGGAKIVDITNPETPFIAGSVKNCVPDQGDIQVRADGMLAGIAKQGGSCTVPGVGSAPHGSILVDLSDVYNPTVISVAVATRGAHNNTFTPDGKYVYVSESGDTPGQIPIIDISNPASPRFVKNFAFGDGGNSPHDIRFSDDGKRAYAAGINRMRILNTENPENPTVISTISVPGSTIGHDILVTPDKSFLFFGEETNGGSTAPCPGGGIYVYDIRGAKEQAPELIGYSLIGNGPVTGRRFDELHVGGTGGCTSHVMDMNPNKKSFTIGWYVAGLATFDFSSLYNADGTAKESPKGVFVGPNGAGEGLDETGWMVPQGANTWAAKQYHRVPGYIFADDINLGFYVTKIKS